MKVLDLINESNDRDFENPLPVDTQNNNIWELSDQIINELLEQYKNKNDITFNKPDGAIDSTLLQKTIKDINRRVSTLEDVPINKILATEKYLVKSHLDSLVDGEGNHTLYTSQEIRIWSQMGITALWLRTYKVRKLLHL